MADASSQLVSPTQKDTPANPGRRKVLKVLGAIGLGVGLGLVARPFVEGIFAQTSDITAEKARAWISEKVDYTSAKLSDGRTIRINMQSKTLALGSKTIDMSDELMKIGALGNISAQAKIVYGGTEQNGKYDVFFFTDQNTHGVIKLSVNVQSSLVIKEPMAHNLINITPGFSLAAPSNSVVGALCGLKLTIFDFRDRGRMRPMDFPQVTKEQNPVNPKLVAKADGNSLYFVMSADNFKSIHIYEYIKGMVQAFPKK